MSALLPLFEWCDRTAVAVFIRDSTWVFPVIETFHILALTVLFGSILVVDLRLLGAGMRRQPVSRLATSLWPYMTGSLLLILTSGVLLFLSEALKCYGNDGFRFKMVFLFFALIFHFTIFRRVTASDDEAGRSPLWRKTVAVVSMTLWLGVGIGGRAIGFV